MTLYAAVIIFILSQNPLDILLEIVPTGHKYTASIALSESIEKLTKFSLKS
jgi:hypothetical protein